MTANRIAALSGSLTGLAAFVAGVAGVLPGTWPNYALAASGLLTKLGTVVTYLRGAQKWDALTLGQETAMLKALALGQEVPGRSEGFKAGVYVSEVPSPPASPPSTPPPSPAQPAPVPGQP